MIPGHAVITRVGTVTIDHVAQTVTIDGWTMHNDGQNIDVFGVNENGERTLGGWTVAELIEVQARPHEFVQLPDQQE